MSNIVVSKSQTPRGSLFEHVEAGIYRNTSSDVYFERPKVNGKRTWRSLETSNLKHAREELHKRRAAVGTDKDPYVEVEVATARAGLVFPNGVPQNCRLIKDTKRNGIVIRMNRGATRISTRCATPGRLSCNATALPNGSP